MIARLALMLLLIAVPPLLKGDGDDAAGLSAETIAATVIEMSGDVSYEAEAGAMAPVELGQMFVEGDRLQTKDASSLQLMLADGSTLSLGPNSELSVEKMGKGGAGSESLFELLKGSVNAIVEKLGSGASFEVQSAHAVAAVKGTQFEFSADEAESAVTVEEGVVSVSDPERKRAVSVEPLHRCLASAGRLNPSFALSKREAGDFRAKWERARMIHGQRLELMKAFAQHTHERKAALESRREAIRLRLKNRDKKGEARGKKGMVDRRKAARERFEKAREKMKKDRELRKETN